MKAEVSVGNTSHRKRTGVIVAEGEMLADPKSVKLRRGDGDDKHEAV